MPVTGWEPVEPLHPELGQLLMEGDGEDEKWPVDPRVYMARCEGEAEPSGLVFNPLETYTPDYWTKDEAGSAENLRNLVWLEKLLAEARLRLLGQSRSRNNQEVRRLNKQYIENAIHARDL